jgi:hypothetical protein
MLLAVSYHLLVYAGLPYIGIEGIFSWLIPQKNLPFSLILPAILRKIVAILFFSVLFMNWYGYQLVIDYFEKEHSRQLSVKFDREEYDESELISVKTSFPLPYLVNSAEFERWDGEVNIDGILYKYVKRRFINDSIEFLCLPDHHSMQLQSARDNFFRLANDLQQDEPNNKKNQPSVPSFKQVLNDYCDEIKTWDFSIAVTRLSHHSYYISPHTRFYGIIPGQPPDMA